MSAGESRPRDDACPEPSDDAFLDVSEHDSTPDEDVLVLGGSRHRALPRRGTGAQALRYVTAAAACVGLAVAAVESVSPGSTIDGAGRLAVTTHASPPTTSPAPASLPHGYDAPIRAVRSIARHPGPLPSYVRQTSPAGACALVRPGHPPQQAIARALGRTTPRFRIRDTAAVLDQFTGLCTLQVRADNVAGAVLVVSVASPTGRNPRTSYDRVQTGFEIAPRFSTKYAAVTTRRGFMILVGATGPMRSLPTDRQLAGLAHDDALTW